MHSRSGQHAERLSTKILGTFSFCDYQHEILHCDHNDRDHDHGDCLRSSAVEESKLMLGQILI